MFDIRPGELVSVVVPAYNHEAYIAACLRSVFEQTYGDIELIVVDDCSDDQTFERAAEWLSQDGIQSRFARVRLLRNDTNLGAHASINRGILAAEGGLLTVVNSDDLFLPGRLAAIVAAMAAAGSGFGFSKVAPIDAQGAPFPAENLPWAVAGVFGRADQVAANFPSIGFGFLWLNIGISTGNFVFHRDLVKEVGLFRPFKSVHDWDFALRSILVTEPVYVPEALYGYRLHGTNSFRSLADIAGLEGVAMSRHFYDLARMRKVLNPLAPVPENWPWVYDLYFAWFPHKDPGFQPFAR